MFWSILGFCGMVAFASRLRLLPMALMPFSVLCLVLLLLTAAGITGHFAEAQRALLMLGCCVGCAAYLPLPGLRPWHKGEYLAPLLLLAALLAMAGYYEHLQLSYWDEFYWGGFAKQLVHDNRFWTWDSPLPRADSVLLYPPAMTILHVLFMPPGQFVEVGIALGGLVSIAVMAFVVYRAARRRCSWGDAALLTALACLLVRLLGSKLGHVPSYLAGYAESTQAALTTSLLCVVLFEPARRRMLPLLLLGLPVLALCKATGILLAACVLGCLALRLFFAAPKGKKIPACFRGLALPTLAVLVAWGVWKIYLQENVIAPSAGQLVQEVALPSAAVVWGSVLSHAKALLLRGMVASPWFGALAYTASVGTLCVLIFFLLRPLHAHAMPRRYIWSVGLLLLGFAGWIGVHFLVSLLFFHADEPLRAASIERYAGTYGSALLITVLLIAVRTRPLRLRGRCLICAGLLSLLILSVPPLGLAPLPESSVRQQMEKAAALLEANTPPNSRYWLVVQGSQGEEGLALSYLTQPRRSMAKVAERRNFNNVNSPETLLTAGQLPENLRDVAQRRGADFMLLWTCTGSFAQQYASTLGIAACTSPQLLDLRAWRDGLSALPERVSLSHP